MKHRNSLNHPRNEGLRLELRQGRSDFALRQDLTHAFANKLPPNATPRQLTACVRSADFLIAALQLTPEEIKEQLQLPAPDTKAAIAELNKDPRT